MATPPPTIEETERALRRYQENEFIGADPRVVRQAIVWVQTRDMGEVCLECGVDRDTLSRNMMSPLFMALVKHINEKINQPDIIGPAWVQVQLLKLNDEIKSGTVDPDQAKLRLQTLRAMQSTLPKRTEANIHSSSGFDADSTVTIDPSDYEDDANVEETKKSEVESDEAQPEEDKSEREGFPW